MVRVSHPLNPRRKASALPALLLAAIAWWASPAASASAAADLATSIASPSTTSVGSYLYYHISAKNLGPDTATNVVITDHTPWYPLPAHPTTFYCVASGAGWCGPLNAGVSCTTPPVGSPGLVSCTTATLPAGASLLITIVVHVGFYITNQAITDTATATSTTLDPNAANNAAMVSARVT